jgi:hypothetical protein
LMFYLSIPTFLLEMGLSGNSSILGHGVCAVHWAVQLMNSDLLILTHWIWARHLWHHDSPFLALLRSRSQQPVLGRTMPAALDQRAAAEHGHQRRLGASGVFRPVISYIIVYM